MKDSVREHVRDESYARPAAPHFGVRVSSLPAQEIKAKELFARNHSIQELTLIAICASQNGSKRTSDMSRT